MRFEEAYNDEQSFALVDDMTLQAPFLGQGIVGEVASTGNHQWLFSDTLFQNQFLSGFKTIAIIPLGSSGVVQLGSTQKVCIYKYITMFSCCESWSNYLLSLNVCAYQSLDS